MEANKAGRHKETTHQNLGELENVTSSEIRKVYLHGPHIFLKLDEDLLDKRVDDNYVKMIWSRKVD